MRIVDFLISVECPDETPDSDMNNLMLLMEDVVTKNNYELYNSEWWDE